MSAQETNNKYEVRVLTLKRWALPHAKSFKDFPSTLPYGDYISFQNYHFIDIEEAPLKKRNEGASEHLLNQDAFFSASYEKLREKRELQNLNVDNLNCDVSIRQSLTLLGKKTEFFEEKPDLLFISMIHLQNINNFDPQIIEKEVGKVFRGIKNKIALYFSLDYCDLILFSKSISIAELHKRLWNLLFDGKQIAKDSSTIFCYKYSHFLSCVNNPEQMSDNHLIVSNNLSLAIDLNVLQKEGLQSLHTKLREICPTRVNMYQITGRYDVRILIKIASSEELVKVVRCLDSYSQAHKDRGFISCEIVPILEILEESASVQLPKTNENETEVGTSQNDPIGQILLQLYEDFCSRCTEIEAMHSSQLLRIAEVLRSILALNKNRFSEEFVLSILPSLKGFMAVCNDYEMAYNKISGGNNIDDQHLISDKFSKLQDNFFNALNMLIQCTMHSERQFIQAPSVNLTLFDIPPKLLVFYAAVAHCVSSRLNDDKKRTFSFLIAPDFRDDIHVRPISQSTADWNDSTVHPNKLLIINLDEESFYKPSIVVELICHEVAHHVGTASRKRSERADFIFKAVAMYVILVTLPLPDSQTDGAALLADVLGKLLKEKYEGYNRKYSDDHSLYYTTDIARFLSEMQAIRVCFVDPTFKESLRIEISEALSHMTSSFLEKMAKSMDKSMNTKYYSPLLKTEDTKEAAYDLMARKIVMKMEQDIYEIFLEFEKGDSTLLCSYCEDLLQAYSEAYADLRMIEILGIKSVENYCEIAQRYLSHKRTSTLQKCLRFNAVMCSGIFRNTSKRFPMPEEYDDTFQRITEYAVHSIASYLSICHESSAGIDDPLVSYRRDIKSPDAYKQIKTIYSAAGAYRNRLVSSMNDSHC